MKLNSIIFFLLAINLFAYALMCLDKWKATKGLNRVSERSLFLMAISFGALGIYLGMKAPVSHKSSKLSFRIGIPCCFILNLFSFYFMEKYFLDISI